MRLFAVLFIHTFIKSCFLMWLRSALNKRMLCRWWSTNTWFHRLLIYTLFVFRGKCDLPNSYGHYCVPDVTVRLKLWVFCPDVEPGCHKVDFDVPLSCSCKKITCRSGITMPMNQPFTPNIPVAPANWIPGNGAAKSLGVINPGSPMGVALQGKLIAAKSLGVINPVIPVLG